MNKLLFLFLVLNLCAVCDMSGILVVIPTPSISHQVAFRPLTQELVKRGHQVTVITTDPIYPNGQAPQNLTEINLHDASYDVVREQYHEAGITNGRKEDCLKQMQQYQPLPSLILQIHMSSSEVLHTLKHQRFDLLILEAMMRPFILYSHLLKGVPVILVSSFGVFDATYQAIGAPTNPTLLYPTPFRQRLFNLSLWEKISELYNHYALEFMFARQFTEDEKMFKMLCGDDTPTMSELEENIVLLMMNVHQIWYLNRPVPPSVVHVGGILQKPEKDLPQDMQSYLDSSVHGVIYISFGTNVLPSMLPPERIQVLINVFSKLPYDVLWKWDKDQLAGVSSNVNISKWVPQADLLRHPKLKLFITQGGLQSTDEAILAGVPLIGMPMLGDQWFNVEQYVHHKIGIRLDLEDITEDNLLNGITYVISNEVMFRKNVARLRSLMYDQPESALSRAVWWTEHVLRHGGRHLRAPAANLSWGEYLDIPLLAVLATTSLAMLGVVFTVVWFIYKSLCTFIRFQEKKIKLN